MLSVFSSLRTPFFRLSKRLSRKGLYPFLAKEFEKIEPNARVLSIGAGGEVNNLLTTHAKTKGFRLAQLDMDPGREPDIRADVVSWRADQPYDVVVMCEVLEHTTRPEAAIRNVFESLKVGGRLVLTVPFVFPIHDQPADYFRFTRFGLAWLLQQFDTVAINERNSWAEALSVLVARTIKSNYLPLRLLSPILVLAVVAVYPVLWIVGRAFPDTTMTTGYNVTAMKGKRRPAERNQPTQSTV